MFIVNELKEITTFKKIANIRSNIIITIFFDYIIYALIYLSRMFFHTISYYHLDSSFKSVAFCDDESSSYSNSCDIAVSIYFCNVGIQRNKLVRRKTIRIVL